MEIFDKKIAGANRLLTAKITFTHNTGLLHFLKLLDNHLYTWNHQWRKYYILRLYSYQSSMSSKMTHSLINSIQL